MKKQNAILRVYRGADFQMLSSCDIIADHGLENLAALQAANSAWNEVFFSNIKNRIREMLTGYFGIKSGADLKDITVELTGLQGTLLKHLTMLSTQIDSNFKNDRSRQKAILTQLGYTAYWDKAKRAGSQTALISLLEVFEKGCTEALRNELTAKKVSDVSIQYVRDNMRRMYELNVRQEGLKDSRKLITEDVIEKFNDIYNTTMSYSRSAQTLFSEKPVLKKEFTYSHISKQLSSSRPSSGNDIPEAGSPGE